MFTRFSASVAAISLCVTTFAGELSPPPGPVAPTMRTLDEVEPRVALSQENTPGDALTRFIITQPGSYFLAGDLSAPSGVTGVLVLVDNVTIDLNGFTITGVRDGVSADGINADARDGVWIRNGRVRSFADDGVLTEDGAKLEDLEVSNCGDMGIVTANESRLARCDSFGNGGRGFTLFNRCFVDQCKSRSNGSTGFATTSGCVFVGCVSMSNTGTGFTLGSDATLDSCRAAGSGGSGYFGTSDVAFTGCVAENNTSNGYDLDDRASFIGCRANDNGTNGFFCLDEGRFTDCDATNNGIDGFKASSGVQVAGCVARLNGGDGFSATRIAMLVDCDASENSCGFVVSASGVLRGCNATSNAEVGIDASSALIESCTALANGRHGIVLRNASTARHCHSRMNPDTGFLALFNGNTIVECTSSGNGFTPEPGFIGGFVMSQGVDNTVDRCVSTDDRNGIRNTSASNSSVFRNVVKDALLTAYDITELGNRLGTIQNFPAGAGAWDNFEF